MNYEKQKLTQLTSYDKDKAGNPLKTKDGRPYTRLLIRTDRGGEKAFSGFASLNTKDWTVGSEIEIKTTETRGQNGQVYFNFETPKKEDIVLNRIADLETKVRRHEKWMFEIADRLKVKDNKTSDGSSMPNFEPKEIVYPEDEIDISQIPF